MYNVELTEAELKATLFALEQDLSIVLENPEDWTIEDADALHRTIAKLEAIENGEE